jgi:predicted DNA-binding WGR domain protein
MMNSPKRRFEYADRVKNAYKFWAIQLGGCQVFAWWGRIGTQGQSKVWEFNLPLQAQRVYEEKIADKLAKGYKEVTRPAPGSGWTNPIPEIVEPEVQVVGDKVVWEGLEDSNFLERLQKKVRAQYGKG